MTEQDEADDPGVEGSVARPGGVSYLAIPARDVARSAAFYQAVFGWELRGDPDAPSFSDGTGHVIGHWRTDLEPAGEAGVRPYVYVQELRPRWTGRRRRGPRWSSPTPRAACASPSSATRRVTRSASGPAQPRAEPRCRMCHSPQRGVVDVPSRT